MTRSFVRVLGGVIFDLEETGECIRSYEPNGEAVLADGLRGEVGISGEFIRGLASKASKIRDAVFKEWVCGGDGMTGSEGSGNVLDRFLGNGLGGGGVLVLNALGGEVGVLVAARGLSGGGSLDSVILESIAIFGSGITIFASTTPCLRSTFGLEAAARA